MSLFDGIPERAKARKSPKSSSHTKSWTKGKTEEENYRLIGTENNYGTGTRSYNSSSAKKEMDNQRNSTTQAYLNGELVFPDVSESFLLCRCYNHQYPHEPHRNELGKFELEHHGRNNDDRKTNV